MEFIEENKKKLENLLKHERIKPEDHITSFDEYLHIINGEVGRLIVFWIAKILMNRKLFGLKRIVPLLIV